MTEFPARSNNGKNVSGVLLMLAATISVASITTFARFAYESGTTPLTLVWMRIVGVLALVGLFQALRGKSLWLPLPVVKKSMAMAIALLLMSVGYLSSVAYITVSLAVILLYTFPIMVGIASPLLGKERMTVSKAICLGGAFAGLMIACLPSLSSQFDWRGVAWAILAAIGVACSVTFGSTAIGKSDPLSVNLWSNIWMLPFASGLIFFDNGLNLPIDLLGWVGALGVVILYVFGFSCVFLAMPKLAPAQIALILNLEPIVSTLSGALLLGERVEAITWLGIIVMVVFLTPSTILATRQDQ